MKFYKLLFKNFSFQYCECPLITQQVALSRSPGANDLQELKK